MGVDATLLVVGFFIVVTVVLLFDPALDDESSFEVVDVERCVLVTAFDLGKDPVVTFGPSEPWLFDEKLLDVSADDAIDGGTIDGLFLFDDVLLVLLLLVCP